MSMIFAQLDHYPINIMIVCCSVSDVMLTFIFFAWDRTPRRKLAQGSLIVNSNSQAAVFNPSTKSDSFPSPSK